MVTVRGEEEPLDKVHHNGGVGNEVEQPDPNRSPSSLPDLVSRPLQLDVGLRELTLTPGVTLEISLQEDLVMTVRLKQEKNGTPLNTIDSKVAEGKAILEISDGKDLSRSRSIISSENDESHSTSTNYNNDEELNDFSNETKDNLSLNLNRSSASQIYDEAKDKSKGLFDSSVDGDSKDDVTKILNDSIEASSSDEEEWTTQNVEGLNHQRGYKRDDSDSTEDDEWGEIFEDCQDYEEIVTDFGCDYYNTNYHVRDNTLQTIIEEDEEDEEEEEEDDDDSTEEEEELNQVVIEDLDRDNNVDKINDILSLIDSKSSPDQTCYKSDNSVEMDSDTEKSELEQFEILEQLCSSSSDDFDPEDFGKVDRNTSDNNSEIDSSTNEVESYSKIKEEIMNDVSSSPDNSSDRISSFKEYLKRRNSTGSDIAKNKEYKSKLTLVQENDGRAKVKPVFDSDNLLNPNEIRKSKNEQEFHELSSKDLMSYSEWQNGCRTHSDLNDEIFDNKSNESLILSNKDRSLPEKSTNLGALNSILRSKLSDKPTIFDEDHNFERKITIVDQNPPEQIDNNTNTKLKSILKSPSKNVSFDKKNEVGKNNNNQGALKSILKTKKSFTSRSLSFSEVNFSDEDSLNESTSTIEFTDSLNSTFDESSNLNSSNFADVSSDAFDRSSSISNDKRDDSDIIYKFNNKKVKMVNSFDEFNDSNLDASFEWREMDNSNGESIKKSVDDKQLRDGNEELIDENCTDLKSEAGKKGGELGRSLESGRMGRGGAIDPRTELRPQVNIFSSGIDDLAAYDFGSDPWFSCSEPTSMRTKKDKSSSSSKDTDQSSSTDSNPTLPKSALKKSGKKRKKHKVQFDESLNKFFEADYVILIREDECECGGELCCSSFLQEDEDEDSFADLEEEDNSVIEIPEPPIEFVDQLTLSPPDGYKDTCLPESINFAQQHDGLTGSDEVKICEDHTTQTTPTSPTLPHSLESLTQDDERSSNDFNTTGTNTGQSGGTGTGSGPAGDRYIVETITMTTVTERRIVRETLDTSHIQPSREELSLRLVRPCTTNKPGSAVRALFPSAVRSPDSEEDTDPLESSLIKRTIERNTLRRSLLKYPGDLRLRRKKQQVPSEESLEEKIRKLTCDIDQEPEQEQRTSPQGQEEQSSNLPQPTYSVSRRLCEVLRKEQHPVALEQQYPSYYESASFLAATAATGGRLPSCSEHHRPMSAVDLRPPSDLRLLESRPLSAEPPGARDSIATDYSLGDIDEVLGDCSRQVASAIDCRPGDGRPDVLAGTPDPPDELALFVEQDASRIERIRKRYSNSEEESDDYGFSRRPSVRGIKPTFGSTTEILQRMQSQVGPGWPYYPQASGLNGCRPGALTPAPSIRPGCQPLCSAQPTVCPQPTPTVMTGYQQHHPVGGYPPTAYLPYSANGYPPRIYSRHDMPLVRATQTPPHYYPRYRVGSPTKGKLEGRIGPEGAASSSHDPSSCDDISLRDNLTASSMRDVSTSLRDVATGPQNLHDNSSIDSSLMYAMNV